MSGLVFRKMRAGAVLFSLGLLAACATTPPPPPPLPPPPPPPPIPARPLPPGGAVAGMFIPTRDAAGVRPTVNAYLTPAQKVWNLRSAFNVAALNCVEPRHAGILPNYTAFLKTQAKGLSATNRALDAEFRAKYGATFRDARDIYMTQVYNYFALPPALPGFCDAALAISNETLALTPADLDLFATGALPRLEYVYDSFFGAFERYRIDVAMWDTQYGARYGITSAGYSNPLQPTPQPAPQPVITLTLPPSTAAPQPMVTQPMLNLPTPTRPPAAQPGNLVLPSAAATPAPGPTATPTPGAVYGPGGRR